MARARKKKDGEPSPELAAPQAAGDTTAAAPDRDRITARAYELYLQRGGGDGSALDDWLAAEREIGGVDAVAFGSSPEKDTDPSRRNG
ncbi:MAG TPA: DUF2934 domain-containing protein [Vicinamibacterales bacterium]|nr:DUF2934 domain-containing protein [Vicinamibacterales bacterium]